MDNRIIIISFQIYSFTLFISMKIIIREATAKYQHIQAHSSEDLIKFVLSHRFYSPKMGVKELVHGIEQQVKKSFSQRSRCQKSLKQYQQIDGIGQLSLYLNKDNNKQIFSLFQHILDHPKGLTYETLAKKLKTDIINISHYCCKLKKLRLIDWDHEKDGVVIYPKYNSNQQEKQITYSKNTIETNYNISQSFFFRELTMNDNIWINISSEESISKGGITNEQIKRKIMKHSQTKMVRRTVESMKYFDKTAERQGKVFEFKYKNETECIKTQIKKIKQEQHEEIQNLDQQILQWLLIKFPQFQGENFLLKLINTKFKDYFSSLGIKQSKRQCTPLKLNRYIKTLNYLHSNGPLRQFQIRNMIVKDQAQFNIGIMHKRSLRGILQGLRNLEIIYEEQFYYFPKWIESEQNVEKKRKKLQEMKNEISQYEESPPRKKVHIDIDQKIEKQQKKKQINYDKNREKQFKRITQRHYKLELFAALLSITVGKRIKKLQRKAFNGIIYAERRKNITKFEPQIHILNYLENSHLFSGLVSSESLFQANNIQDFYKEMDNFVEQKGGKQLILYQGQNELIKFIRKNPTKNANSLRIKYGKQWISKFSELIEQKIVEVDQLGLHLASKESFLI